MHTSIDDFSRFVKDQPSFFPGGQVFDLVFPAHRLAFGGKSLIIYQFHGSPASGILGPFFAVMVVHPFLQIVGPSGIERSVLAFYNISIIHDNLCTGSPVLGKPGGPVIYVKQSAKVDYHIEERENLFYTDWYFRAKEALFAKKRLRVFNMVRYFLIIRLFQKFVNTFSIKANIEWDQWELRLCSWQSKGCFPLPYNIWWVR